MKKALILLILPVLATFVLVGCTSQAPMTEAEQAASYGLTLEEYREEKQAAARMNMTIEEHMRMLEDWEDMWDMDMDDMEWMEGMDDEMDDTMDM